MRSWGFIEVVGYIPAVAAADATAVDAGAAAAKQAGQLHCAHVIARPAEGAAKVVGLKLSDDKE